jgi:ABC-type transport system substrate-binding protein
MVPIEYTQKDNFKALATKPVGTGPFTLKSRMKGSELVLTAKKDCWKGAPKIDEVDENIDKAAKTIDPQKHSEYLQIALREMWADPAFGYLFQQRDIYGVNKRIVWEARSDEDINLYGAYLK